MNMYCGDDRASCEKESRNCLYILNLNLELCVSLVCDVFEFLYTVTISERMHGTAILHTANAMSTDRITRPAKLNA